MSVMENVDWWGNPGPDRAPITGLPAGVKGGGYATFLNSSVSDNVEHIGAMRCYSVDRPIMRDSHSLDWGSNPHSSILFFGFKPDSERFYASPARERSTVPTAGGIEEGVQGGCLPVMGTAGRDLLTPSPEHRHKPGPQPIDEP